MLTETRCSGLAQKPGQEDQMTTIDYIGFDIHKKTISFCAKAQDGTMTGVVLCKKRWIGGKDGYEVTDYEINTPLMESLNSIEKRAAVETGQETDRQDINV